mmetsp:Transcript_141605/g.440227  ORF Transcript_141605/g.440227 Transcript_141605/m.440227 type:complete len:263 (+) Transcript_141605:127-915(+)
MAGDAQVTIKRVLRCRDDYYAILDVDKQADDDAIKKAYRKLALRLHPDKCSESGAEDAFKKVGEAFSVLSDPQKRRRYDQYGIDALREGGGAGGGPGGVSPEDIFEAFFGGAGGGGGVFSQGGPGFVRAGGPAGFQSFRFTTGGPGGVNFMHFTTGPGGAGGPRQRRGGGAAAPERQRQDEEAEPENPEWLRKLQVAAAALGPLQPFAVMAIVVLALTLMGQIFSFIMSRAYYFFPILYLTEGRTKALLLSSVFALGMVGVI